MNPEFPNVCFPGWEVVRKLGQGSFGGVYEIQRTLPDGRIEKAALKKLSVPRNRGEIEELLSQSFSTESITAHYKDQMGDLVREYSLMQELGSCGNVVTCHDIQYVQQKGGFGWDVYIRMELLTPLKKALNGEYREETVIKLGLDLCNALKACQKKNIIHRDIKPENILVSEDGDFKLTDFGIAKVSEKTGSGTLAGTNGYMAPEVANRKPYGASADIYSLGMVLYWMMNERTLPFLPLPPAIPTAKQRQEVANRRFDGEPLPPPVHGSPELKQIVQKACAFMPKDRYHTVEQFESALKAWNNESGRMKDDVPAVIENDMVSSCGTSTTEYSKLEKKRIGATGRWPIAGIAGICAFVIVILLSVCFLVNRNDSTAEFSPTSSLTQQASREEPETIPKEMMPAVTEHIHSWREATYNDPQVCTTCGETRGTAKTPVGAYGLKDIVTSATASSVYEGDKLGIHGPENLYDGKLDTNWAENVPGYGIGEYVIFNFDGIYAVKEMQIYVGTHLNEDWYKRNCRPKVITLTFSDGSSECVTLTDTYQEQTIRFERYYYTDSIKLTIDDVYPGWMFDDTVIAELNFTAYRP